MKMYMALEEGIQFNEGNEGQNLPANQRIKDFKVAIDRNGNLPIPPFASDYKFVKAGRDFKDIPFSEIFTRDDTGHAQNISDTKNDNDWTFTVSNAVLSDLYGDNDDLILKNNTDGRTRDYLNPEAFKDIWILLDYHFD